MRNIKPFLYLYQLYVYIILLPLFVLFTLIFGTLGALLTIIVNERVGSLMGVLWAKFNSYITPMFVKVIGKDKINKKKSYVIVANHQSMYDIFVVYGWMPVDFKWVMKIEMRTYPMIGYSCDKMGHVFIDRSNQVAALESINSARDKIKDGTSIMFFPEGTWSKDGKLLDFKKGAFRLALDMGLPVLPVTIVNIRKILPSDKFAIFPGSAKMVIHDPISIDDYNKENMDELMERARESIQKGLDDYS
ncbi:lysophospholipid acyltransferase family protein [Spirochaetota bacterium]